jgi:hypothetical protein
MRWIDKPGDVAERGVFLTADYVDLRRFFSPHFPGTSGGGNLIIEEDTIIG